MLLAAKSVFQLSTIKLKAYEIMINNKTCIAHTLSYIGPLIVYSVFLIVFLVI